MNYLDAKDLITTSGMYASADYYRMQTSKVVALGIRDQPMQILVDVSVYGGEDSKKLLEYAIQCGYVERITEGEHFYYDVVDIEDSGAPYYFRSHIAMQIAYPEIYWEFFGEGHVWTFNDPRMRELVELTVSCLTNTNHPSDYYGRHHLPSDEPKKGRPAVEKTANNSPGFSKWVIACQEYKQDLSTAWTDYIQACADRKIGEAQAKEWRDTEMDKLRNQMKVVSEQYANGVKVYSAKVESAKVKHGELKTQGKPQRSAFE